MGVIDEVVQVVEVLVTKHLRNDFNHRHVMKTSGILIQDDQGYGEFEVKHHAVGMVKEEDHAVGSCVSPAHHPHGLSPPDPLLVQRRPHLHLVQRHQRFKEQILLLSCSCQKCNQYLKCQISGHKNFQKI